MQVGDDLSARIFYSDGTSHRAPPLVKHHGFTSSYDLNKHKTRECYSGLTLSEGRLGGRRSDAHRSGFRGRPCSGASEYLKDLHVALEHAWKCGGMLKHAKPSHRVHVSPFSCVRCNLKLRFWTYIRGKLPVRVKPGRIVPSPCEAPWFYIII